MTKENSVVEEKNSEKTLTKSMKPKTEIGTVNTFEENVSAVNGPVKKEESVVYVGQSLPGFGLQQFSIFNNGLPEAIKEQIRACPPIGSLMVPVSQLSEARRNLNVEGSAENVLNQQIQLYVRGEK